MNIINAIRKARESQQPSTDGFNAIKRSDKEESIYLIPIKDDCIPLDEKLCRETGETVGTSFSIADLLAEDWEVPEKAPEE